MRPGVLEQKLGALDHKLAQRVFGYEPKFKLRENLTFLAMLAALRNARK